MKFLFHIAYIVCVSSLPISLDPVPQSLVELRNTWNNPPTGYQTVARNKYCDVSVHEALMGPSTTIARTRELCQAECDADGDCRFFLWRASDCTCATFSFCGKTSHYDGGYIFQRWAVQDPKNFEPRVQLNDKYCCNYNPGKKCSRNVLILDTDNSDLDSGDTGDAEELWQSQDNCEASCTADATCEFYLWRETPLKTCATFRNCKKKNRMGFGSGNNSCIYKKMN